MSDVLDQQNQARDQFGRWRKGQSGNLKGRTPGSKNKKVYRKTERARAAEWTDRHWRAFRQRTFQQAQGEQHEKHGAAWAECMALWLLLNPPRQQTGLCGYCSKPLDVPGSSITGAPIRVDGAWVHWGCLPWFCRARWDSAKNALQRFGITENAF